MAPAIFQQFSNKKNDTIGVKLGTVTTYSGLQPREVQRNRESLCSGTLKGAATQTKVYLIRVQSAIENGAG